MNAGQHNLFLGRGLSVGLICAWAIGCFSGCALHQADCQMSDLSCSSVPRELNKVTLPVYRVEPPDILLIQAVQNIRPSNKPLRSGDQLVVRLQNGLPFEVDADPANVPDYQAQLQAEIQFKFVNGDYPVGPDGSLDLGPAYGKVPLEGLTLEQARVALKKHLMDDPNIKLANPVVSVQFATLAGRQPIDGQHLVRPDGTVGLGIYGNVYVAGMTLDEVKSALESHLGTQMERPELSVDILAYNSKVVYIVMDGGGFGEQVIRIPYTGSETVLDAMSQVYGLPAVSSKHIWVARPAPADVGRAQILDVQWNAIVAEGVTTTNYQLMPGDRIYVQADKLMATNFFLTKLLNPIERVFGGILLGNGVVKSFRFANDPGSNF